MGNVKVRNGGAWFPPSDSPGILTKGTITSTFSRGAAAVYVDNDAGGWSKLTDLIPAQPTSVALTNDSGRIVVTWNVSGTGNLQKYQIYSATSAAGPYTLHATEPTPTSTSESFVFGRLASAPGTRYIFVRSVAPNGLYQDSSVSNITIPGLSAWATLSHSRGASGWHSRSFTFTAAAETMGSTVASISSALYRRANTSAGWEHVTTYTDNDVSTHTKTYSFSSYSLGQQMFAVVTTITDNQTKQNDGSTGAGYSWTNNIWTTELTAADITGTTPTITGVALSIAAPNAPVGSGNGADYGYSREISVNVGFSAWTDRSEYSSFTIRCYKYPNWELIETKTLTAQQLLDIKSNQTIAQTQSFNFSGLERGTSYIFYAQAFDPGGGDPENNTGWIGTYGAFSSTWSQYIGTTTSDVNQETRADQYFNGTILAAPAGPNFNPASYDALKDNNTGTYFVSKEMTGSYERIRFYGFADYSRNDSSVFPGTPGYKFRFLRTWTPQSHNVWHQVYDNNNGQWISGGISDPSVGNPAIGTANVNNNWGTSSWAWELQTSTPGGNLHYCNFDIRAVIGNKKIYGTSVNRIALAEISVGTTWRSRFDNYETRTYYW